MKRVGQFLLFAFSTLFLVHCNEKLELQCGCEDKGRDQYLVQVRVGDEATEFLREVENLDQNREIDIYGICLEQESNSIYFCAESRGDYRELEERFQELSFRDQEYN